MSYNFNYGAGDNGNAASITNNIDGTRSQTFQYDALNRLQKAQTTSTYATSSTHCWEEAYLYDNQPTPGAGAWSNLTSINVPDAAYNNCLYSEGFSQTVDSNNRIIGFGYNTAGNQTGIPGGNSYTYDAENHLVSVSSASGNYTYTYDGDGDRVEKSNGEIYWYTSGGEVLDETDLSGNLTSEYIFFGGARIARRDASGNVFYYLADHLGSSREIVQAGQTTACYDADFYPFGGERAYTNSCQQNYKFTGKERDPESGLDNFEARYYGSSIARFTSPDDPFVGWQLNDPQSLNLYAYVQDNPINDVDPTGHMTSVCFTAGGSPATTAFASSDPCGFAANPMDPASDQEDPQTTYMTIADMGDPEGFGRANSIEAGEQQHLSPPYPGAPVSDSFWSKLGNWLTGKGWNQPMKANQDQKPPSWDPSKPLPDNPSKLGPDWKKNPRDKNPYGGEYVNDTTGEKIEWNKGRPGPWGPDADRAKDGWHYTPPGGTRGRQLDPGQVIKNVGIGAAILGAGASILRAIKDLPMEPEVP